MSEKLMLEALIKSEPEIRHLFDVACPMHTNGKKNIESILIICKSMVLRKYILDSIKTRCNISEYKPCNIEFGTNEGDTLSKITQAQEGDFLLCDSDNLTINDAVRKILVKIMNDASCEIQLGKGPSARQLKMEFPQITFVFSCEQSTAATEYLKKYCQYVIDLDDTNLKRLCEPYVSALLNESDIRCSSNVIKVIAKENDKDLDKCYKCVSMIKDYMEFNSLEDSELTYELLQEVIGKVHHNIKLEYLDEIRLLRQSFDKLTMMLEECDNASELLKNNNMDKFMRNVWTILREIESNLL